MKRTEMVKCCKKKDIVLANHTQAFCWECGKLFQAWKLNKKDMK